MQQRIGLVIGFILLAIISIPVTASAEGLVLGTYKIPGLVESDSKGAFVDIALEIQKRSGQEFSIEIGPPKRVFNNFKIGKIFGYFPALDAKLPKEAAKTEHFFLKNTFVFVKKGSPYISTTKGLEGKRVGLTEGFSYSADILDNPAIQKDYAKGVKNNLKKLAVGRIDAFVCDAILALREIKAESITNVDYDSKSPISSLPAFFAFQPDEAGRAMAEKFTKAIQSMKQDGTYNAILAQLY